MPIKVTITIPEVISDHIVAEAARKGVLPEEYVVEVLVASSYDFILESTVARAKKQTKSFCVKALFSDDEWDQIPKRQKMALGRSFYKLVIEKKVSGILVGRNDRSTAGIQFYEVAK